MTAVGFLETALAYQSRQERSQPLLPDALRFGVDASVAQAFGLWKCERVLIVLG